MDLSRPFTAYYPRYQCHCYKPLAALHRGSPILSQGADLPEWTRFLLPYLCATVALFLGAVVTVGLAWTTFQPANRSKVPQVVWMLAGLLSIAIVNIEWFT